MVEYLKLLYQSNIRAYSIQLRHLHTWQATLSDFLRTSIIDMFFHNPVTLARRFATLDALSGGRVIAGLGIGWSKDEYDAAGVPFRQKGARADEYLQVLKRI